MAGKYQQIMALAEETAKEITSDTGRYLAFLTTAAHNFKYSFRDQLLIFAQRPDTTACAEISFWNSRGRWVNRGTRGIALLVDTDAPYKLRYVFDMSDTNSRAGQTVPVWRMEVRYEAAVMESLENSFEAAGAANLPTCLLETAGVLAEDNITDYLGELTKVTAGSLLEELDPLNTEIWLKETLKSSVAFMLLVRCGYEPRTYFSPEDFSRVCDFNTPETVSVLGAAVSSIAEVALREIAATVFSLQRAERQKYTFASRDGIGYDEGGRKIRDQDERSERDGTDIQAGGGLSAPQPQRTGDPETREVWDAAADLPPTAPERLLHRDAGDRQAERPLGGDRPAGDRDDGSAGGTDGQGAGSDRGPQSPGPDEMGGADEQHPGSSGGDGAAGADLQLTALPSEEEQRQAIAKAEVETTSAFAISQGDTDAILLRDGLVNPPQTETGSPKEYRFSLGDTVQLGTQEYEVIALGEETVRLFDPAFPLLNKELPKADFDRMLAENPLNDHFLQTVEPVTEQTPPDYDLGYGYLGNGLTVWNRSEKENGDYKTIAHIDTDRKVAFYEDSLPEEVRAEIEEYAAKSNMTVSATQDSLVFHTPPVEEPPQKTKPDILGQEVQIEDRRYIVDSLDRTGGTVSLRDVTFQDGTGFPIFRVESIARVREWLEPAEEETFPPATPDRTAEMLQQAQLANELSQQTGQMVFAFEEGNAEPVNLPEKRKELLAPPAPKPRARVSPFVIHPEVPDNQRQNF